MFTVPLPGDVVENKNGVKLTVSSYAPHKDEPAVYADSDGKMSSVPFEDIAKINGNPVELTSGMIFTCATAPNRTLQLPQVHDKVAVDGYEEEIKVKSLKLRDKKNLSKGILIVGVNQDTKAPVTVRLADVVRIIRASGPEKFTRRDLKTYQDYLGVKET